MGVVITVLVFVMKPVSPVVHSAGPRCTGEFIRIILHKKKKKKIDLD